MATPKPNYFVATISLSLADKLRTDLIDQGFEISVPQYTVFSAQKKGVSCTLYTSGKLMVQGKEKDEFISFYLEPEILQTLAYSYPETQVDMDAHIGIDESGKGDFFGPLCIAGVQASSEQIKQLLSIGVKDSKALKDTSILGLSVKIKQICPHVVVYISPKKYNELYANFRNLNSLLAWGHATAIADLTQKTQCRKVIIDQFASEHLVVNALKKKNVEVDLTQLHRAEADPVVAAASILARAAFVDGIQKLGNQVGIELPKGASALVIKTGKKLVATQGSAILETVAKLHFKTKDQILE